MNRVTAARSIAAVLSALVIVVGTSCGDTSSGAVSYMAQDLVTGDEVSLASMRGEPTLLVSWATWCRECDEELAGLQAFSQSTAAEGIEIIAVNLDAADVTDEINAKIAAHGLTTRLWRDRRNEFKRVFGALGVPTTIVIDADGTVVGLFAGAVDFDDVAILDALAQVRDVRSS